MSRVGLRSIVMVLGLVARAQAGGDDVPKADALFAEALGLKEAGHVSEACAKFEQALAYNRNAIGTILNVALCDEQAGKLASAVKWFSEARDLARERNLPEQLRAAEDHLVKDEPLVAHLAVAFTEPPGPATRLLIDDQLVATSLAGNILIDPGSHVVTVTAPGRVSSETKIDIAKLQHEAIAIPKLAFPVVGTSARPTVGKVVAIGGAGLIASSVVLGLIARADYRAQFQSGADGVAPCSKVGALSLCTADGHSKTDSARTLGTVATVVGITGVVAIGVGGVLWLIHPGDPHDKLAVLPVLALGQAGLAAVGRF